jgi:AraC-like DNA-binding protein
MNQISETEFMRLSATELAAKCRCSPRHFNRYFFSCFGKPIRQKQQEARLLWARQILEERSSRIDRIAKEAGFKNLKQFNAAFIRQFGVAPEHWLDPKTGKKVVTAKPPMAEEGA